jgi:type II secretory pathway component PulF
MTLLRDIKKIKLFISASDILISELRKGKVTKIQSSELFQNLPSTLPILSPSFSKHIDHEQLLNLLKTFFEEKLLSLKCIGASLLYPALIFISLIIVSIAYLFFVIPTFSSFLSDMGQIPTLLSLLLTINQVLASKWEVIILCLSISIMLLLHIPYISSKILSLFFTTHRSDLYFLIGILLQQGLSLNEVFLSLTPKKNYPFYIEIYKMKTHLFKTGSFYKASSVCFSLTEEEHHHLSKGELLGTLDQELIILSKTLSNLLIKTNKLTAKKLQFFCLCLLSVFITIMIYITFIPLSHSLNMIY